MPKVVFQLNALALELDGNVLPAVNLVKEGLEALNEKLGAIPTLAQAAATGLKAVEEIGKPAIEATTLAVVALREQLQAATEDARRLATALAQVAIP